MDVASLAGLLESWDAAVTVTLEAPEVDGSARRRLALRDALAARGAKPRDLDAIDEAAAAPSGSERGAARVLAARAGRLVLHEPVAAGPDRVGTAHIGPVVDVVPLLRHRARGVPVAVVRVGPEGAEAEVVTAVAEPPGEPTALRLHRAGPAQVWRGPAGQVAAEVNRLAGAGGTVAVLVQGGARHLPYLEVDLEHPVPILDVDGDTGPEGALVGAADPALLRFLDGHAARAEQEALRRWRSAGAVTPDLAATVAAIRRGQVAELLLVPDELRPRRLVLGPGGADLAELGAPIIWPGGIRQEAADLALIRAAAFTGARVHLIDAAPATLPDGAAALLRHRP